MSLLRVYYSPSYAPSESPQLARLALAAEAIERSSQVELVEPPAFDVGRLDGLHCAGYVSAFRRGIEPLASSQGIAWSPAVRDATFAMLSGQLAAASHALQYGVAMNLARGFHHAVRERGMGFCALNGLALVAHCFPDKRIFVLDCDEHGGNGTEEFAAELNNLFTYSIFGTRFGCRGGLRSWAVQVYVQRQGFVAYETALRDAQRVVAREKIDLILYQAGADCHWRDPKGRAGLTTRQLYQRDLAVFRIARDLQIPVLFNVAGGYQNPLTIARLNANTVRAACKIFDFAGAR
ncbi:histone deacetylase [Proteobacteria bacterium 005FR1]|nr:histone deacetylase [Proteobacteria bacterium 005FR1]